MKFISLHSSTLEYTFKEAVLSGLACDGHLLQPQTIPKLSHKFLTELASLSLVDIGFQILNPFMDEIPENTLKNIIKKTFNFPIPLIKLNEHIFLLELFHGPTLAFKDFGARFMAEILNFFLASDKKKLNIIVATSGDTGSAVANGFQHSPNIDVYILFPSNKISPLQEKQITTLGGNIHPIEVLGNFDDCQQLLKKALMDKELQYFRNTTTANSINIARLLPQIVYYFFGIAELQQINRHFTPTIVVPSGNYGNLTAAAYAKEMGAPIKLLVAATNINCTVPEYLTLGRFTPRAAITTLSNAMDVGDPNNFPRLLSLFHHEHAAIAKNILGSVISDEMTIQEIQNTYHHLHYILDPHTAVGVAAAKRLPFSHDPLIVAATAHPAKFQEVIKAALNIEIDLPPVLKRVLTQPKQSQVIKNDYSAFKNILLEK